MCVINILEYYDYSRNSMNLFKVIKKLKNREIENK